MVKLEISDDTFYNMVYDWKKKDVSVYEKAEILRQYIKQTGISERGLGKLLDISHSTIHDWVSARQKNEAKVIKKSLFYYADRLLYLISVNEDIDERTKAKLKELKSQIEKMEMK